MLAKPELKKRFEQLPGITFVRGMLKNYARLLKLAPEPLLERIAGRFQAPDASRLAERYSQPVPFSDGARHSTFVYLGLSIVVLSLGGGVAYQWYREHNAPTELVQAEPAPAAPRGQVKVVKPVVQSELTAQVAVAPEAEKPAPPEKPALAEPPAVEKVTVAKVVPRGGVNRLIIRCEEDAWIEVKDANDRMLVSSLNPKGAETFPKFLRWLAPPMERCVNLVAAAEEALGHWLTHSSQANESDVHLLPAFTR